MREEANPLILSGHWQARKQKKTFYGGYLNSGGLFWKKEVNLENYMENIGKIVTSSPA